jgi:bifunctional enzyme CysN/CysC
MSGEHHDYRGYAGRMAGGTLRDGQEVIVLPAGKRSHIRAIDTFDGKLDETSGPASIALRLTDALDVSRGDLICPPEYPATVSAGIEADVCWMADRPVEAGQRYRVKHATRWVDATVTAVRYRTDVETLLHDDHIAALSLNDIGRVELALSQPVAGDLYRVNRTTGSLILVDRATNGTVGAGMITAFLPEQPAPRAVVADRCPGGTPLTRRERWQAAGQPGATVWLTGLPAAGKSTTAMALEQALVARGRLAYHLDGDELRAGLRQDLGFSLTDREENVRRVAAVARILADTGVIAIVSLISPYRKGRASARRLHEDGGLPFLEVHLATPLEVCEQRDPKGLYARARRGEISGLTGLDAPYETPREPDLVIGVEPLEQAVDRVLGAFERRVGCLVS